MQRTTNYDRKRKDHVVKSCKWVDEVVEDVPYVMSAEYVQKIIDEYDIDYIVHGDDPCIVDGKDVYESAKQIGKYLEIPRTEGVSTTQIVGRLLLLSGDHHRSITKPNETTGLKTSTLVTKDVTEKAIFVRESNFMTTATKLREFQGTPKPAEPGAKIVYIDGAWDMFHAGHVEILQAAKNMGSYLLVGIHNDTVVNFHRGGNFPIMNINERMLSVLGCNLVDDVLLSPPWIITSEMIRSLNISIVVKGTSGDSLKEEQDPYAIPRQLGILCEITSSCNLCVSTIAERIFMNREKMEAKFQRKSTQESEYYEEKYQRTQNSASHR